MTSNRVPWTVGCKENYERRFARLNAAFSAIADELAPDGTQAEKAEIAEGAIKQALSARKLHLKNQLDAMVRPLGNGAISFGNSRIRMGIGEEIDALDAVLKPLEHDSDGLPDTTTT
jgi:hypothetical protein